MVVLGAERKNLPFPGGGGGPGGGHDSCIKNTYPQATRSDVYRNDIHGALAYDVCMVPIWMVALSGVLGLVAGAALMYIGGMGGMRRVALRCDSLEGDMAALSERITREQKRRAGVAASDARADIRTDKELAREATERLAKENADGRQGKLPGFPSVFNRG